MTTIQEFDSDALRGQFPTLASSGVGGGALVYLDSAATGLKPRVVIDAISDAYAQAPGSVHRGLHALSRTSTEQFEEARGTVAHFLGVREASEVVFTRGTTDGVHLVAEGWAARHLESGDEILVTGLEHHSNLLPWRALCARRGLELRVAPLRGDSGLDMEALEQAFGPRTRLVACAHVSNVLGTVQPLRQIADFAHARGALLFVDGAQAVGKLPVDVRALGCDFYAFSGHKVHGPTGVGVLWGRSDLLARTAPVQRGGEMVLAVSSTGEELAEVPRRFEAGTPHVVGAIGLAAALRWLSGLGLERVEAHGRALRRQAVSRLRAMSGVRVLAPDADAVGVVSFHIEGCHPHDLASLLDAEGIALRAGHLCAQPLLEQLGLSAVSRASFAVHNSEADIDALMLGLSSARGILEGRAWA